MPVQIINGVRTHYREWHSESRLGIERATSTRATILVLHGWGADSAQYESLGSMLAAKNFHVIAPDLPGFGNTPTPEKVWGVGEYVEWVREFIYTTSHPERSEGSRTNPVRDRTRTASAISNGTNVRYADKLRDSSASPQNDKIILFGHSFGGRIAIKYAIKHPDELRALILCAAAGIKPPLTIKRVIIYCIAKIGKTIFKPPGLSFAGEILKRILYRLAGVNDYFKARGIMKQVLNKTVKEDLKPLLHKITTRTLLLWGTKDLLTPYKDGQTMSHLIPNAKLITFQGERHNLPKLIPEKLAIEITKFLK